MQNGCRMRQSSPQTNNRRAIGRGLLASQPEQQLSFARTMRAPNNKKIIYTYYQVATK